MCAAHRRRTDLTFAPIEPRDLCLLLSPARSRIIHSHRVNVNMNKSETFFQWKFAAEKKWKSARRAHTSHLAAEYNEEQRTRTETKMKNKKKIEIKSDEENGSFVVAHKLYLVGLTRSNM